MSTRDVCPVCSRDFQVNKDGRLRHHGSPWGDYRCKGAGTKPLKQPPAAIRQARRLIIDATGIFGFGVGLVSE